MRTVTGDVDHDRVEVLLVEQARIEAVAGDHALGRHERAADRPTRRRVAQLVRELRAHLESEQGALLEARGTP